MVFASIDFVMFLLYNLHGYNIRRDDAFMKLVIAVVQDEDSARLLGVLLSKGLMVTKLATTGGFLRLGNTTLLIGVEESRVDEVMSIINDVCKPRDQLVPAYVFSDGVGGMLAPNMMSVEVGGATVFVLNVEQFVKM